MFQHRLCGTKIVEGQTVVLMAAMGLPESHRAPDTERHTAVITPFTKVTFLPTFTLKYSSLNGKKKAHSICNYHTHTRTNKVH